LITKKEKNMEKNIRIEKLLKSKRIELLEESATEYDFVAQIKNLVLKV
jgi:hypothetical protein